MQLVKLIIVVGVFSFSIGSMAQDSTDYNDNLKQQLKQEDALATPQKKVVHKRIRKSVKKSLPSKTVKVAEATDSTAGTTSVKVKETETTEVEAIKPNSVQSADTNEAPALGQKYGPQQQPYQPIFILNPTPAQSQGQASSPVSGAQAPAVAQAQVQPTTNVDSTAVPEPKSEALRRQRNDLEHATESKLIERLEDDRLKSEKERADRILNPQPVAAAPGPIAVEVVGAAPTPAPSVVPQALPVAEVKAPPAPIAVATPAPAPVVNESVAKVDAAQAKPEDDIKRFSVGPVAGLPSYPTVNNVTSYYTLGVMGQYKFANRLSLQSAFDYSKFDIKNASFCPFCFGGTLVKGVDQYNFSLGMNYNILPYTVTPVVGLLVDYARRSYTDKVTYGYTYGTPTGSNAFDAGVMAGVDVELSKSLTLGFQFAYMWNLSYWTDDPLAYGLYGSLYGQPLESLSYYMGTLNVRFMF